MNIDLEWPASAAAGDLCRPRYARMILAGFGLALLLIATALFLAQPVLTLPFRGLILVAFVALCAAYVATMRHVRHQKDAEAQLVKARNDAEAADRRKATLLADASREIRGALTAILGFCDLPDESDRPAGAADPLAPIRRNARQILFTIDRIVELPQHAPAAGTATAPNLSGRVLLAEDGPDNQKVIAFYLRQFGLEVTVVSNGRLAYEKAIAAMKKGRPFDLILMDMRMPDSDGCAATIQLRNSQYKLPIIALTASATAADRQQCFSAGCTDFLAKPIDRDAFYRCLARHLDPDRDGVGGSQAPASDPSTSAQFIALQKEFRAEVPARLEAIRQAADAGQLAKAADLAHQLKGTAGCYGMPEISIAAAVVQKAAEDPFHAISLTDALAVLAARCGPSAVEKSPIVA